MHRCGFEREPPAVVCEAEVVRVDALGASAMVTLRVRRKLREIPPVVPNAGQNSYEAGD